VYDNVYCFGLCVRVVCECDIGGVIVVVSSMSSLGLLGETCVCACIAHVTCR
jgi:hypothetical protein